MIDNAVEHWMEFRINNGPDDTGDDDEYEGPDFQRPRMWDVLFWFVVGAAITIFWYFCIR